MRAMIEALEEFEVAKADLRRSLLAAIRPVVEPIAAWLARRLG
jgi:hypothetical protein